MGSEIGGLLFLLFVVAAFLGLGWLTYAALRGQSFRTPLAALAVVVGIYAVVLLAGGAFSKDRRVPLGTTLCFDDWCASVVAVHDARSATPGRRVVLLDVRVSSVAKRVVQRGSNPQVYVIDASGKYYAAARASDSLPGIDDRVAPGQSFDTRLAAQLPADAAVDSVRLWEGAWIDAIVPFDEGSPLYKKTVYNVTAVRP